MCEECNKCFKRKSDLKEHQDRRTGVQPHPCNVCSKLFSRSACLRWHQRSHMGERPYKCSECNMRFTEANDLKCHARSHTGERPYQCRVCGKSFSLNQNLKQHDRTHTGERPFSCKAGGKSFNQNTHLKRHRCTLTDESSCRSNVHHISSTTSGNLERGSNIRSEICGKESQFFPQELVNQKRCELNNDRNSEMEQTNYLSASDTISLTHENLKCTTDKREQNYSIVHSKRNNPSSCTVIEISDAEEDEITDCTIICDLRSSVSKEYFQTSFCKSKIAAEVKEITEKQEIATASHNGTQYPIPITKGIEKEFDTRGNTSQNMADRLNE